MPIPPLRRRSLALRIALGVLVGAACRPASPGAPDLPSGVDAGVQAEAARPGHAAASPLPSPDDRDLALLLAAAGAPTEREVELVLDRGELDDDGAWISGDVGQDRLHEPALAPVGGRVKLALPVGGNVVTVLRSGCGDSRVPLRVGPLPSQSLPYPGCGAGWTVEGFASEAALRHFRSLVVGVPGDDGALGVGPEEPARWLDHAEAEALCGWLGGGLPEATGEPVGGLAGEWLADGTIALFSGGRRASPAWAREGDVGARCRR